MSGPSKELDEIGAGSSGMLASSEMEGEDEYYNPDGTEWSQKAGLLCRICANPNEYLIPIFDGEGLEHELGTKIQKHLPIKVTETDTLPIHVCYQCASTLIAWHDLVNCCVEADKKLRELQMVEDDEDDDDKGAEMFESHSFDSEMVAEDDGPSTSELQNQAPEIKSPKKLTVDKKSKLKMVLVKGSAAGTSGQKIVPKIQVAKVELGKPKEGTSQDSASERFHQIALPTFNTSEHVLYTVDIVKEKDVSTNEGDRILSYKEITPGKCTIIDMNTIVTTVSENINLDPIKKNIIINQIGTGMEQVVEDERNIFECEHCGKILRNRNTMIDHLRIHSEECLFACHICGKKFRTFSSHYSHFRRVHEKIKNIACEICGRKFADRRTRDDHRRTHTGERPYVCEVCGKLFKTHAGFYNHNLIHKGVFACRCSICHTGFYCQSKLALHMMVHTKEKPHVCEVCGKGFQRRYMLAQHKLIHTDVKPFSCSECGCKYRCVKYLRNHLKVKHKS